MVTEIKTIYGLGWHKETTLGHAWTALAASETACYKFGDHKDASTIKVEMLRNKFFKATSYDYDVLSSGELHINANINFRLMDALPLYFAMGKVAEGGGPGPHYTHTLSCLQQSDTAANTLLPSMVVHYEADDPGTTSHLDKDFFGCRVNKLTLKSTAFQPIECSLHLKGIDLADGNHINAGLKLMSMALVPLETGVNSMYLFDHCTYTWSTVPYYLLGWELNLLNGLELEFADGQDPVFRAKYNSRKTNRAITFQMTIATENKTLMDEIRAQGERSLVITVQRLDATDKITLTLNPSSIEATELTMPAFNQKNVFQLVGYGKALSGVAIDHISAY